MSANIHAPMASPRLDASPSERAWLIAAAGLYLALATWVLSSRHYWPRYDSAVYVSASTALSRGIGLRDITSPVTRPAESWANIPPWVRRSPERMSRPDWPSFIQYPPVLPLALAPLVALGGGRFVVLQLVPLLAGLGTLVLVYRWRETLFPGPWRLTLLICAGSMLTLYGTRVQSEAVHPLFALGALRLLAWAGDDAARLVRWAALAALVLLLGAAVHVKLVFFAAGAAVWLLLGQRAPAGRRLWVAAAFAALTVVPPALWVYVRQLGRPRRSAVRREPRHPRPQPLHAERRVGPVGTGRRPRQCRAGPRVARGGDGPLPVERPLDRGPDGVVRPAGARPSRRRRAPRRALVAPPARPARAGPR